MRIIGQSTLASGSPYAHLGYLAATHTKPYPPLLGGSLVVLTLGAAMAFTLVGSKVAPGWRAFNVVRRRFKTHLACCALLVVLGGAGLVLSNTYRQVFPPAPSYMTSHRADVLLDKITALVKEGKPVPEDLKTLDSDADAALDGWANPMRLEVAEADGAKRYAILSAGSDGTFGTADDVRTPRK